MNELINALKELLSDVAKMYSQAHGYHWNVQGRTFKQDHAFLLEIYEDVYDSIDPIAENILKLGAKSPFGLVQLQQGSALQINDNPNLTADAMISELIKTNLQVSDKLKQTFDIANRLDKQGVANFLAERIDKHDFWQWQLTGTLK